MTLEELFSQRLQEIDAAGLVKNAGVFETTPVEVELLSNNTEDLKVDAVFYLDNAIYATAEDKSLIKELKEKKQAIKPDDMIEKAHPESVWAANALGDAGLVENQNEQQEKIIQMLNKMPTGNLIHTYAEVLTNLVSLANSQQDRHPEAAALIDRTIAEITGQDLASIAGWEADRLQKTAIWPLVAAILLGVGAGGYGIYQAVRGVQEKLDTDTKQLADNIDGWKDNQEFANLAPLTNKMSALAQRLNALSDGVLTASAAVQAGPTEQTVAALQQADQQFDAALDEFKTTFKQLQNDIPSEWFVRTEGLLEDVVSDYALLQATSQSIAAKAPTAPTGAKEWLPGLQEAKKYLNNPDLPTNSPAPASNTGSPAQRIQGVQDYLANSGFGPLSITGQSDEATKAKLVEFESYINTTAETDQGIKTGLGVRNLPGNRLAKLLDSTLTADQLHSLAELFHNPSAAIAREQAN